MQYLRSVAGSPEKGKKHLLFELKEKKGGMEEILD